MDRNLRLQVVLNAVDLVTGPLKKIVQGSSKTAAALKAISDQKKQLDAVQKSATGFTKTQESLRQTSQRLVDAREKVRAMQEAMRKGEGNTAKFRAEFTKANLAVRDLTARSRDQRIQLNTHRTSLREAGFDTSKFAQSQQSLSQRIKATSDQMKVQQQRLDQMNRSAQRYARAQASLKKMHGAGMSTLGHGLGAAYMGRNAGQQIFSALTPGISYGKQISELQAVSRLSKDDPMFAALKKQARELGGTTAFAADDAAAGQTFLARAGFSPKAILASMSDVLDLALGNDLDLARTADISSNISSAFKIDPEVEGNMRRVTDILSATATRTNVNLEMLGDTMKYLGQAEGLNVTLEESAVLAGLLGNIGIQGGQAGTTLRAMLNRLSSPMAAGVKAMKEIGLSVEDQQGNMRGITDILDEIFKKTENLGNVKRADLLKKIFGSEAGSGMAELVNQQGGGAIQELLNEVRNAQGENYKMARIREDNIHGGLKDLESAWDEIGITLTDTNEGPIRDLIRSLNDILIGVSVWMKANPELTARIAKWTGIIIILLTVLGTLGIALGGTLMLFSGIGRVALGLIGPLKLVGTAVMWLGRMLMLNPIGLLITAIAAGAYLIWKYWAPIKAFFQSLWDGITTSMSQFWSSFKSAWDGGFVSMLAWTLSGLLNISNAILNWSPIGLFYKGFAAVMAYFGIELPSKFSEFGKMLITGLIDGITSMFGSLKNKISEIGEGTITWFKDKLGIASPSKVFATFGRDTIAGYNNGLDDNSQGVINKVSSITKRIAAAGAGVALTGAAALPAAADINFDTRPPLARSAPILNDGGDTITIQINAAPGMDERAIALHVQRILDDRDRKKSARRRAALYDND